MGGLDHQMPAAPAPGPARRRPRRAPEARSRTSLGRAGPAPPRAPRSPAPSSPSSFALLPPFVRWWAQGSGARRDGRGREAGRKEAPTHRPLRDCCCCHARRRGLLRPPPPRSNRLITSPGRAAGCSAQPRGLALGRDPVEFSLARHAARCSRPGGRIAIGGGVPGVRPGAGPTRPSEVPASGAPVPPAALVPVRHPVSA